MSCVMSYLMSQHPRFVTTAKEVVWLSRIYCLPLCEQDYWMCGFIVTMFVFLLYYFFSFFFSIFHFYYYSMYVCLLWRINVFISCEWILWKFWESRPWDKNNWLDLEWSVSRNFSFLLNFNTQIAKLYCYSVDVSNNIIPMLLLVSLISTLSGSLTLRILRSPWRRFELVECSYFYTELMHCGCMVSWQ